MIITILGAPKSKPVPNNVPSAQDFLDFFNKKVEAVCEETGQGPATTFLPPAAETLNCFQLYTEADVAKVITAAPSKSRELYPIPTDILKQFLPVLLPYITKMCNTSLQHGILPTTRSAIVTTRLKKAGSDPADVRNYRPISSLTFMSKVVSVWSVINSSLTWSRTVFSQTCSLPTGAVVRQDCRSQGRH